MRHRISFLALSAVTLLAAAPPAHAGARDSTAHYVRRADTPPSPATTLTISAAPESIRVFLLTQLDVPQALAADSTQLAAHEQRAIVAMMAGLAGARVPVHVGMVFHRDHDVPGATQRHCSDATPPPTTTANDASRTLVRRWHARPDPLSPLTL